MASCDEGYYSDTLSRGQRRVAKPRNMSEPAIKACERSSSPCQSVFASTSETGCTPRIPAPAPSPELGMTTSAASSPTSLTPSNIFSNLSTMDSGIQLLESKYRASQRENHELRNHARQYKPRFDMALHSLQATQAAHREAEKRAEEAEKCELESRHRMIEAEERQLELEKQIQELREELEHARALNLDVLEDNYILKSSLRHLSAATSCANQSVVTSPEQVQEDPKSPLERQLMSQRPSLDSQFNEPEARLAQPAQPFRDTSVDQRNDEDDSNIISPVSEFSNTSPLEPTFFDDDDDDETHDGESDNHSEHPSTDPDAENDTGTDIDDDSNNEAEEREGEPQVPAASRRNAISITHESFMARSLRDMMDRMVEVN